MDLITASASASASAAGKPWVPARNKIGITESKKAKLDSLSYQVTLAQQKVEQYQAVVNSLTTKSADFTAFLAAAGADKARTLANLSTLNQVIDSAKNLFNNSKSTFSAIHTANVSTKVVTATVNNLINKLIYSADLVNKLSNLIIKQKAINPLISDDLIDMVATAGKDANNAVALTLVALESVFAAQSSNIESASSSSLELLEAASLYGQLRGKKLAFAQTGEEVHSSLDISSVFGMSGVIVIDICYKIQSGEIILVDDATAYSKSLKKLITDANTVTVEQYDNALIANNETTKQLNNANSNLAKAQVTLKSLQAGLAAATAAALAS